MTEFHTVQQPHTRTRKRRRYLRWQKGFLDALAATGNVSASALAAGCERSTAYKARERDPGFAEAWDEALERSDDVLRLHARRLAMGYFTRRRVVAGEIVEEPIYSERVLIELLKSRDPSFRPGVQMEHSGSVQFGFDAEAEAWLAGLLELGEGEGSVEERLRNAVQ